jgi:sucrose-6-phosphate hydrolase SacC (GH32 family)
MIFQPMEHPDYYIWDFWYYFDVDTQVFHVFYLYADPSLVFSHQHHFQSRIGYGITSDFITMQWKKAPVLEASGDHWANTSIWSGDVIKINNGFLLFYTSRNQDEDDGMTQNIGIAYSDNLESWYFSKIRIPPGFVYESTSVQGDLSIHAWRDPFLFRENNQVFMLVSAKSIYDPIGRKGVIGLLRMLDNHFSYWEYLEPLLQPSCYSEMEVPQLYQNPETHHFELIFSSWAKGDFSPKTNQAGGLQGFTSDNWQNFRNYQPHVLLPENQGLYACRIIPELEGEIVGFDIQKGGICRSGIKTKLRSVNRIFTDFDFIV